jgi:hypothetical protein
MSIDAEDPDPLVPEPSAQPEEPRESPFVTIWEAPRETIRYVVATDPWRWVAVLFFASGFVGALSSLPTTLEQRLELDVPVAVIFGVAVGFGLLAIPFGIGNAMFKRWVGSLLGGDARWQAVVAVGAYASIPSTVGYALVLAIQTALYGLEPFRPTHPTMDAAPPLVGLTMWLGLGLASFWSVCVSVVGFAEVNRFSIARSIATSLLTIFIAVVTITITVIVMVIAISGTMPGDVAQ